MTISPAVFVHGLIGPFRERDSFAALSPRLVSAPDLNGYGQGANVTVTVESQTTALHDHMLSTYAGEPVHLVAHSIGAVYAFTLASRYPELVRSVVTVEGNFSLADAFWSQSISALSGQQAEMAIKETLDNAVDWLRASGIEANPTLLARAEVALAYQPWRTVWESAQTVVEYTSTSGYAKMLQSVFERIPVHLVAGERSESDWHVPAWARANAASTTTIPSVGHMMMMEAAELFGTKVAAILNQER